MTLPSIDHLRVCIAHVDGRDLDPYRVSFLVFDGRREIGHVFRPRDSDRWGLRPASWRKETGPIYSRRDEAVRWLMLLDREHQLRQDKPLAIGGWN